MKRFLLAGAAVAAGIAASAGSANAAIVVTSAVANQLYTATGQTMLWDFDGLQAANTLFTGNVISAQNPVVNSAAPPLEQAQGGISICCAGNANYYADPTKYGSTQANQTSTFKTLNGNYLSSFSFYMGSPDSYNRLVFSFVGGGSQTFSGQDIWGGAGSGVIGNGDRTKGFRVYYDFNGAKVNQITFSTGATNAFEYDGLAGAVVPEPATWALMIGGFGAAGAMLRRRRAALTA